MTRLIIAIVFFIPLDVFCKSPKTMLRDGLILAYYLKGQQFEEIQDYLLKNDYKFNEEDSREGIKHYLKINSNLTEGFSLAIDTREQRG